VTFETTYHEHDRILEIVYPARPTQDEVTEYVARTRATIDAIDGPWFCLVDQRRVTVLPPSILVELADLNAYAQKHGMRRTARLVASPASAAQSRRLASAALLALETFSSRDEAIAWLRST
jgi:hypothetical protein